RRAIPARRAPSPAGAWRIRRASSKRFCWPRRWPGQRAVPDEGSAIMTLTDMATGGKTAREEAQKIIADNRKAHHDYHLIETFEATPPPPPPPLPSPPPPD